VANNAAGDGGGHDLAQTVFVPADQSA
jgi:hypothetical protein